MSVASEAAVCHRCGSPKLGPFVPCKACGFVPVKEARAVAWLFSAHHLNSEELSEAARRIREGDAPDPSRALRSFAQREMGAVANDNVDLPLFSTRSIVGLVAANLLLTPLVGVAYWFGLRERKPLAARQAARWTLFSMGVLAIVWAGAHFGTA